MRKLILFLLIGGTFFSCSKSQLKEALVVSFDLPQKASFTIPGAVPSGLISLPAIPIATDWNSTLSSNKTDINHLKSLSAKSITLVVTSPHGQNLHFLKSINIYISDSGQTDAQLAYKNPVPDNVDTTLALDLPTLDIAPYVKSGNFKIKVTFEQRETILHDIKLEADMIFHAQAYLLN